MRLTQRNANRMLNDVKRSKDELDAATETHTIDRIKDQQDKMCKRKTAVIKQYRFTTESKANQANHPQFGNFMLQLADSSF